MIYIYQYVRYSAYLMACITIPILFYGKTNQPAEALPGERGTLESVGYILVFVTFALFLSSYALFIHLKLRASGQKSVKLKEYEANLEAKRQARAEAREKDDAVKKDKEKKDD